MEEGEGEGVGEEREEGKNDDDEPVPTSKIAGNEAVFRSRIMGKKKLEGKFEHVISRRFRSFRRHLSHILLGECVVSSRGSC